MTKYRDFSPLRQDPRLVIHRLLEEWCKRDAALSRAEAKSPVLSFQTRAISVTAVLIAQEDRLFPLPASEHELTAEIQQAADLQLAKGRNIGNRLRNLMEI